MFGLFKRKSIQDIAKDYDKQWHRAQVSLFMKLSKEYKDKMDPDLAGVLAAQVTNYLGGEDIDEIQQKSQEPLKSQISKIKIQIKKCAKKIMDEDPDVRKLIVYTLRMKSILNFGAYGETYMNSPEKVRAEEILKIYGHEFPEEARPEMYASIADSYYRKMSDSLKGTKV